MRERLPCRNVIGSYRNSKLSIITYISVYKTTTSESLCTGLYLTKYTKFPPEMGLNKMGAGFKRGIEVYVTERMPHTNSEEEG